MAKHHSPRFLRIVEDAKSRVRECTVHDVKVRLDKGEPFHLIDVREESEFARGHLPGAMHLGKGIIERAIEEKVADPEAPLALYCGGGYRRAAAAGAPRERGYAGRRSMDRRRL